MSTYSFRYFTAKQLVTVIIINLPKMMDYGIMIVSFFIDE